MMHASQPLCSRRGAHPHRPYHILHGCRPGRAQGRHHHAARPQRRRQDHHAAHHHGPLAGIGGRRELRRAGHHQVATPTSPASTSPTCPRTWASSADLTVRENICWPRARRKGTPAQMDRPAGLDLRLFPALKKFWPAGRQAFRRAEADAGRRPRHRRAAPLLIVDEPSKGLAPAIIHNMIDAFAQLKRQRRDHPAGGAELQFRQAPGRHRGGDGQRRVVHAGSMADLAGRRGAAAALLGCRSTHTNEK
jgi:branched-chain amino acid transport system ATP-binding protein